MPSMDKIELHLQKTSFAQIKVPRRLAMEMGLPSGTLHPITITKVVKSTKQGRPGYIHFSYKHPSGKKRTCFVRPQNIVAKASRKKQ